MSNRSTPQADSSHIQRKSFVWKSLKLRSTFDMADFPYKEKGESHVQPADTS